MGTRPREHPSRTSLLEQGPALGYDWSSSALQDKRGTTPGKRGSLWPLSWPCTSDQRPTFPPSQECSQSQNTNPSSKSCWKTPAKQQEAGLCFQPTPCREEQIPADVPCRRVSADCPSLSLLILSSSASTRCQHGSYPAVLILLGELHYTSSSWVRLLPSAHASSLACYPRSPGLALDTLESRPGSAPVSPWDCHRLELARARENTSRCL